MTKKDHEKIAAICANQAKLFVDYECQAAFVGIMADMLAADNPRFDRKKFVQACWPSMEEEPDLTGAGERGLGWRRMVMATYGNSREDAERWKAEIEKMGACPHKHTIVEVPRNGR